MVNNVLATIRKTANGKLLGASRRLLGVIFFSTGSMKFLIPMLWVAWSGQRASLRGLWVGSQLFFVSNLVLFWWLAQVKGTNPGG